MEKSAYICGPLTELSEDERNHAKRLFERIADICKEEFGIRGFVPHEHYDPVIHADYTPAQVDAAERKQVCENTSVLIVVALAPSWGGGIEVEMANRSGVPALLLCEKAKLDARKISRLLRGNPAMRTVIVYRDDAELMSILRDELRVLMVQ